MGRQHRVSPGPLRFQILVIEQQRSQGLPQMPMDVIGQQAQEQMSPYPRLHPMTDGTDVQVDGLQRTEGPLHPGQVLVAAHHGGCWQTIGRFAGPQHVEPVQLRLPDDGFRAPLIVEGPVCDLGPEVFGHLEAVLDAAEFLGDLRR